MTTVPKSLRKVALLAATLALLAGNSSAAAEAPKVDFSGVYMGMRRDEASPYRNTPFPYPPPFTAKGRELSRFWADPKNNAGAKCLPGGGPYGTMSAGSLFPIEIVQRPDRVFVLAEAMQQIRRIFTDGRKHPDYLEKAWQGHSVGHWEGDTLVVDTIGVHNGALNGSGAAVVVQETDRDPRMPYTETMRMKERLRLLDGGKYLEADITIEDPTVYTAPLHLKRYWRRADELELIEYICTENRRPELEGYGDLAEEPSRKP